MGLQRIGRSLNHFEVRKYGTNSQIACWDEEKRFLDEENACVFTLSICVWVEAFYLLVRKNLKKKHRNQEFC